MQVNGSTVPLDKSRSLFDFLTDQKYDLAVIAVLRNGEVVPRASYKEVMLSSEDSLEVVQFVGGG